MACSVRINRSVCSHLSLLRELPKQKWEQNQRYRLHPLRPLPASTQPQAKHPKIVELIQAGRGRGAGYAFEEREGICLKSALYLKENYVLTSLSVNLWYQGSDREGKCFLHFFWFPFDVYEQIFLIRINSKLSILHDSDSFRQISIIMFIFKTILKILKVKGKMKIQLLFAHPGLFPSGNKKNVLISAHTCPYYSSE